MPQNQHDDVILECLEDHRNNCRGETHFRMSLSPTGVNHPRCDYHWAIRLKKQEEIDERYPDTPIAPANFDPTYAGERWDEDDY